MPVYTRDGGELAKWALGQRRLLDHHASKKQDDPERIKMILRVLN